MGERKPPFAEGSLVRALPSANDPEAGYDRYTTFRAGDLGGHNKGLLEGDILRVTGHYWITNVSVTEVSIDRLPGAWANILSKHLAPAAYGNEEN